MPEIGDVAPDFALRTSRGEEVRLSDLRGRQRALLVFYPKDKTSGWTNQLVAVRDAIEDFRAVDTIPFGVNPADAASHQSFIDAFSFPFDLLVDDDAEVARAYDAVKPDGERIERTVVVVGKDGRIIFWKRGAPPPGNILRAIREAQDEVTPAG